MIAYENQILDILESGRLHISTIKPSNWTEENMIMQKPFPGPFRYSKTPYTREIIDCLAPDHPSRVISVMKGAQIGFSAGVIYPGIGWIIKNNPGNTLLSLGSPDLIEKSMEKIDLMIDACGLRTLIKPSVIRNRAGKSGDTNLKKEFPLGYVTLGSANNHKAIRQVDLQYIFMDDYEAVKKSSKESGSTRKLIEQRGAAYADISKIFFISTPEIKPSNIEEVYLLGDQRKFLIPCPCCGAAIEIKWTIPINDKENGGITWRVNNHGKLIDDSVGYICQECGGFFDDSNKGKLLIEGFWKPTAEPSRMGYYSYHISSLYAPAGMFDWKHYINNYLEAHPEGKPRKEDLYKSHVNLCLGETYEEIGEDLSANDLQTNNIRNYDIGNIPEKLSIADGNGKILLITMACDLNGKLDDARLDYEVVAWSESGSSYSITHGSIGTFIPHESGKKNKVDREKWTYENHRPNNVWVELDKLLSTVWRTDTGRNMKIFFSGVDTGYCELQAFTYIDKINFYIIGLKGDKEDKYVRHGVELPNFKKGLSRSNLFLLKVGQIKDDLSDLIKLKWDHSNDPVQPIGFLNFPIPSGGKYLYDNFFSHYEAEQRILDKDNNFIWRKKSDIAQNHLWDCRVYNMALRDILVSIIGKQLKIDKLTWKEYVDIILKK
jgi:phage terminase large subunit GpA-like protein